MEKDNLSADRAGRRERDGLQAANVTPAEPKTRPDPARPLADPRLEDYAQRRGYECRTQADSWKLAYDPRAERKTAGIRASELMRRPDVAARVAYLHSEAKKRTSRIDPNAPRPKSTQNETPAPQGVSDTQCPTPTGTLLTLDEARERITHAVRRAKTSIELTQALRVAQDILRLDAQAADAPPDPTAVLRYVTQAAGRPHREVARELGGLRWMIEQVCLFAHAPPSEVARACRAITAAAAGIVDAENTLDTTTASVSEGITAPTTPNPLTL